MLLAVNSNCYNTTTNVNSSITTASSTCVFTRIIKMQQSNVYAATANQVVQTCLTNAECFVGKYLPTGIQSALIIINNIIRVFVDGMLLK